MSPTIKRAGLQLIGVSWIHAGHPKSERYLEAVRFGGGCPAPLLAGAKSWSNQLPAIRALVLTGGGDVDPARYGENNVACRGVSRDRDELEAEVLDHCLQRSIPVLAICRGLQFINVALGGSLIQDIQTSVRHGPDGDESSFHEIEILAGSRLAKLAGGAGSLSVNSRHHQGVDLQRVAPRLRVSAIASDGIVEGLELDDHPFFIAVQSHPEYLGQVPRLDSLFAALVAQTQRS